MVKYTLIPFRERLDVYKRQRIARPEYQVPYADYEFTFIMMPVKNEVGVE